MIRSLNHCDLLRTYLNVHGLSIQASFSIIFIFVSEFRNQNSRNLRYARPQPPLIKLNNRPLSFAGKNKLPCLSTSLFPNLFNFEETKEIKKNYSTWLYYGEHALFLYALFERLFLRIFIRAVSSILYIYRRFSCHCCIGLRYLTNLSK